MAGDMWQPRFYAVCAVSTTALTAFLYATSPDTWAGGFIVGYGAASVIALLFLAVQHWSLRAPEEAIHT